MEHLRGCYTREILIKKEEQKSGSGSTRRKPYLYFEQMRFLETLKKNTDDSIFESEKNEDEVAEEINMDSDIFSNRQYIKRKQKREAKEEDNLVEYLKNRYAERSIRRKEDEEDGDKLFLLSLLPELKKVVPEKKLKLKSDMLSMIASAESLQTHIQPQIPQYPYRHFNPEPLPYQYSSMQEINPFQGHNQMHYSFDNSKYLKQPTLAPTMPSKNYQPMTIHIQHERSNSVPSTYQQNHQQSKLLEISRKNNHLYINSQDPTMQQINETAQSTSGQHSNSNAIYSSNLSSVISSPGSEDYQDLF